METLIGFWVFLGLPLALVGLGMAKNRGRSIILGALAGWLFGLFAVVYYWIVGDTKAEKLRKAKEVYELANQS